MRLTSSGINADNKIFSHCVNDNDPVDIWHSYYYLCCVDLFKILYEEAV